MKYIPPQKRVQNTDAEPALAFEQIPLSEEAKFTRWETEIEQNDCINKNFFSEHQNLLRGGLSKFVALANYRGKFQKQIEQLRRIQISMAKDCYLDELAEEISIDTMADAQHSRGTRGFYTKERNTQRVRQNIKDESPIQKKTKLFKSQMPPEEDQEQ